MKLSDQLSKMNVGNLKMKNGKTVTKNLEIEAKRLKQCIQNEIDNYYDSYKPEEYVRTFRFKKSLYVEDFVDIDVINNTMFINLKFDEDLAYHDSIDGTQGYIPLLINDGWCWDGYTGEEDHFRRYDGFHFFEKGIEEWNKTNTMGFKVTLDKTYEGDNYFRKTYR